MLKWTQIQGHRRNKEVLERAVGQGRLHHALLFAGPDGVGKRALAVALAAVVNCVERQQGAFEDACGVCVSCHKVRQNAHPDLILIEPEGNVVKTIKIEQIRRVQKAATTPPFEAREQVVVLLDAHAMGEAAANALLKTLEEPTGRMRMILTSDQPHLLLDTILSRCQLLRFGALEREQVADLLRPLIERDEALSAYRDRPELATIAAAFGEGSVGRAWAILSSGVLEERAELLEQIKRLRPRHPIDYLSLAEEYAKDKSKKELIVERLDALKVFFRDVMRAQIDPSDEAPLVNLDLKHEVARWAEALSPGQILDRLDAINQAQALLQRRVNTQLVMERALRSIRPDPDQLDLLFARR